MKNPVSYRALKVTGQSRSLFYEIVTKRKKYNTAKETTASLGGIYALYSLALFDRVRLVNKGNLGNLTHLNVKSTVKIQREK